MSSILNAAEDCLAVRCSTVTTAGLLLYALFLPCFAEAQREVARQDQDDRGKGLSIGFETTASFWWTLHEEVENGLFQPGSGEQADAYASGFSFRHGRLGFKLGSPSGDLELLLRLRLEERTDIVDFHAGWISSPLLRIYVGQMKVPSTAEVLTPYDELDFASRSTFGQRVGDYSLTRTPYISSLMAAKSHNRDLGLAAKGSWADDEGRGLSWFAFAGNGLGANRYIGGGEHEEFLFTNSIGELYYGGRLEVSPHSLLAVGLHASHNHHENVSLGERGPVFDIERKVWTADFRAGLEDGWRLYAFYGHGDMDDFFDSQQYLFDYSGWGAQGAFPLADTGLELALRFDSFTRESARDGNETAQNNWTGGVNFSPRPNMRLQLNYIGKQTENAFEPDLDDDILFLNFQFFIDSDIGR